MDEAAHKRANPTKGRAWKSGEGLATQTLIILLFVARMEAMAGLGHSYCPHIELPF